MIFFSITSADHQNVCHSICTREIEFFVCLLSSILTLNATHSSKASLRILTYTFIYFLFSTKNWINFIQMLHTKQRKRDNDKLKFHSILNCEHPWYRLGVRAAWKKKLTYNNCIIFVSWSIAIRAAWPFPMGQSWVIVFGQVTFRNSVPQPF